MLKKLAIIIFLLSDQSFYAAQAELEKEVKKHKAAEEIADKTRNYIDKELLEVNTDSMLRSVSGTYYSYNMANTLEKEQKIDHALTKIEHFIQGEIPECSDENFSLLVNCSLMKKHNLFNVLITKCVDTEYNQFKQINGKTLDKLYKNSSSDLSPFKNFIHQKALEKYKKEKKIDEYISILPFDKQENEIHQIALIGFGVNNFFNVDLLMSSDGRYLRAMKNDQSKKFWDMKTGMPVKLDNDSQLIWARYYEDNHHCAMQRVIDQNRKYLLTPGLALAFGSSGIHAIVNANEKKYAPLNVMTLFQRPTLESSLCLDAFLNSQNDPEALAALKNSELIKEVDGFPGENLKRLIQQKLAENISPKL